MADDTNEIAKPLLELMRSTHDENALLTALNGFAERGLLVKDTSSGTIDLASYVKLHSNSRKTTGLTVPHLLVINNQFGVAYRLVTDYLAKRPSLPKSHKNKLDTPAIAKQYDGETLLTLALKQLLKIFSRIKSPEQYQGSKELIDACKIFIIFLVRECGVDVNLSLMKTVDSTEGPAKVSVHAPMHLAVQAGEIDIITAIADSPTYIPSAVAEFHANPEDPEYLFPKDIAEKYLTPGHINHANKGEIVRVLNSARGPRALGTPRAASPPTTPLAADSPLQSQPPGTGRPVSFPELARRTDEASNDGIDPTTVVSEGNVGSPLAGESTPLLPDGDREATIHGAVDAGRVQAEREDNKSGCCTLL